MVGHSSIYLCFFVTPFSKALIFTYGVAHMALWLSVLIFITTHSFDHHTVTAVSGEDNVRGAKFCLFSPRFSHFIWSIHYIVYAGHNTM